MRAGIRNGRRTGLLPDPCGIGRLPLFVWSSQWAEGRKEALPQEEGKRNGWMREEDFSKEDVFYDISDLLALTKKGAPKFSEKSYTVEKY